MIDAYKTSEEYKTISDFYGNDTAVRSGVKLINHIHEGCDIIRIRNALPRNELELAQKAFCLHPVIQMNHSLKIISPYGIYKFGITGIYALEYRGIANAYLSKHYSPTNVIDLSPFAVVNEMLVADKIQNRKDFEKYHLGTHANSDVLDAYFKKWLAALGVTENEYSRLTN